jgi:hypothetical protein
LGLVRSLVRVTLGISNPLVVDCISKADELSGKSVLTPICPKASIPCKIMQVIKNRNFEYLSRLRILPERDSKLVLFGAFMTACVIIQ